MTTPEKGPKDIAVPTPPERVIESILEKLTIPNLEQTIIDQMENLRKLEENHPAIVADAIRWDQLSRTVNTDHKRNHRKKERNKRNS